jgi:predicted ribosomally synthesized peptide with nif11-like leader
MSVSQAEQLLKKLADDPQFRTKVTSAPTPEAKQEIVAEAGFSHVTKDDIAAAVPRLKGELSDAELEAVAGGGAAEWVIAASTVTIAAATAAAAAA